MKKSLLFLGLILTTFSCEKAQFDEPVLVSEPKTEAVGPQKAVSASSESDGAFASFKPSADYEMLFTDRFLNNNIGTSGNAWWTAREGQISSSVGPVCYNHAANLSVVNGILDINYNQDAQGFLSGGGVKTVKTFGYGYYEVRAKLYTGCYGFHQSFWSTSSTHDVNGFEFDSRTTGNSYLYPNIGWYVSPNPHVQAPLSYLISNKSCYSAIDNSTTNWITFGYEWLPDVVNFYADGVKYATLDRSSRDPKAPTVDLFSIYSPCQIFITGAPYAIYKTVPMGIPLAGAKMQVENVAYSAKKLPGINLLGNESFEYYAPSTENGIAQGVTDWFDYQLRNPSNNVIVQPGVNTNSYVQNVGSAAHSGSSVLVQTGSAVVSQKLNFIPNGTYKLSAWIKCSAHTKADGFKFMILGKDNQTCLLNSSGAICSRTIGYAHSGWIYIEMNDIVVTNNYASIAIKSDAITGEWSQIDDIKFSLVN